MGFLQGTPPKEAPRPKAVLLPPDRVDRRLHPEVPAPHPTLEDRARMQYEQQANTPQGQARRARIEAAAQQRPSDPLGNGFLVTLVVVLIPVMVGLMWWFIHMKPSP